MTRLIRRRLGRGDDSGFAMMSVLLAALILTMLGTVLLANGMAALPQARHKQDFDAALAAAEAGVDDFVDRLNQNYDYADQSAANPGFDGNSAFSNFVPIAASSTSSFRYSVNTSARATTGVVTLSVTGRTGKVTRNLKVGLRPYGFLDALSQTDYNLVDPALFPLIGGSVTETTRQCVFHAYDANPVTGGRGPASGCGGMLNYWITGNVLDGPMQSNDDYYLYGTPRFNDTVDSGDPTPSRAPYWVNPFGGSTTPNFAGGAPRGQRLVTLPPNSRSMLSKVTVGGTGTGCLYTGPTSIRINGTTMSVVSPATRWTNPGCVGSNLALPANRTIYVQDIPGSGDVNYSDTCPITVGWSGDDCRKGDAFVDGTLADQLTIAADNNIVITGNLTYDSFTATSPRRALGLIATNSVVINHPVSNTACASLPTDSAGWCNVTGSVNFSTGVDYTVPLVNPTVNASILSLQHSFAVLNFNRGPAAGLGDVRLKGTVAGRFMDIEGTFGGSGLLNGYNVDYAYDDRLRNGGLVPPNFLDPERTFWHRVSFVDCRNATTASSC